MKVLLVDSWGHGGISIFCAYLARHLAEVGASVDAFCYMEHWPDAYLMRPHCGLMGQAPLSLTEMLSHKQYDIVHLSTCAFGYPLSAAVHIRRARFRGGIIATAHQPNEGKVPAGAADILTAVSETAAQDLEASNSQQVSTINNGVNTSIFHPGASVPQHTRPILGWIGRADDTHQKDVLGFLYIASALRNEDFDFWIIDGSPSSSELMQRLPDWFGDRIKYRHNMPHAELPDFYRGIAASGGALISTSAWEGIGFTILEAWACGCPTIVPRVRGLEYVAQWQAGLVYDRAEAVAQIIALLPRLRDAEARRQLINNAYDAIQKNFTVQQMADRYIALYNTLLSKPSGKTVLDPVSRSFWNLAARTRRSVSHTGGNASKQ